MEITDDIRPQFLEVTNLKSDDLIFMWNVKKINKRGKTNKRILVITTNSLYLVEKKPLHLGLKISVRYGYESMKSIEKDDKGQIIIKFDDHTLTFLEVLPNSVVGPILEQIFTIFLPSERPDLLILKEFPIEIHPKPNSSFWRLKFKSYLCNKSHLITADLRQLMNIMITLETIDFSIFHQYPDLLNEILDSLIVCPNLKKLIFRNCFPTWEAIAKFISINKTMTSLETYQPIDDDFIQFARFYNSNPESVLNTLSFSNNEFGASFVEGLKIILQRSKIVSLSIRNHLTKEGYQAIAPLILNFEGFQSVKYLDVSGCKYVEPEFVIIQLTNLTTLVINDCSIDISILLEDLNKNKHIPLTEIHCSDNFCSENINPSYSISKRINTIVADSIFWQTSSLSKFLSILSNTENSMEINLSIRNAQMSILDWNSLDEFLQTFLSNTIVSLDYSGNKVLSGFCTFLNSSPKLTKLTINGCFLPNDNSVELFSRYLSSNQNLEELYILGTEVYCMASSANFLFRALKTEHFLHVLDVSHNNIGNQVLALVFSFVSSNPNVTDVYFDYNNISDPQKLQEFVQEIAEIKRQKSIHLPLADISHMVQNGLLKEIEVEKMKESLEDYDENASLVSTRKRNNSLVIPPTPYSQNQNPLRMSGGPTSAFRSSLKSPQLKKNLMSSNDLKRLNSLSSIDAFSQSLSNNSYESSMAVRSTSANSLNSLGRKVYISSSANHSDSSSKEQLSIKKKKARRSSDIIFAENKSNIPFEEQLKFEQVRDEYISDNNWVSFLNDIPNVNFEPFKKNLDNQFSYFNLMQALQPK